MIAPGKGESDASVRKLARGGGKTGRKAERRCSNQISKGDEVSRRRELPAVSAGGTHFGSEAACIRNSSSSNCNELFSTNIPGTDRSPCTGCCCNRHRSNFEGARTSSPAAAAEPLCLPVAPGTKSRPTQNLRHSTSRLTALQKRFCIHARQRMPKPCNIPSIDHLLHTHAHFF